MTLSLLPPRLTAPYAEVLDVLLAFKDQEIHGWPIKKVVRRSNGTVYKILERLEKRGYVDAHWEEQGPDHRLPRRRLYRLNPAGVDHARAVIERVHPNTRLNRTG